jgi:hypothetical protein
MITLLIAVGALFIAVIGSALLDPWTATTALQRSPVPSFGLAG